MIRRATPDSETVISSEDDVPWPHQNFGSMPRSENSVPGLGGGIWSQTSRGSFKLDQEARRAAARQAQFGGGAVHMPGSTVRSAMTPSPTTTNDPSRGLPFSIPLRPTAKAGRSLSHSQGQREMPALLHAHAGASDRGGALALDLVNETEETDTESEPDLGHHLTQTTSHPARGFYQRSADHPLHFDMAAPNDRQRVDIYNDDATSMDRLGSAIEGMRLDGIQRNNKQRWQTTSSGWDELHTINESRRHSLAGELPTRRGSLAAAHEQDYDLRSPFTEGSNYNDKDTFTIPSGYRVPQITLDAHERADIQQSINMHAQSRPRKELYIVVFKCSRAGVFYLLDNTGLTVSEGDMVIVEADRGQDLGTVQHARVSPEEARALLQKYSEEQYKWLMMFSRNNQVGAVNPNATGHGENQNVGEGRPNMPSTKAPRDQFQNLKPKAIKRMAAQHEVRLLKDKEGNEAKAKRCCQQKVFQHHLDMEILEAEFQWDWQKLIFYYYADHYVNFKELVNDLYKLYKVRLWMSAVNPASFSANAINQPPSGIGPGAITAFDPFRSPDLDNSYAMAYGSDPDPYGAVPPYQIGYNTYVPNFPSIPGMPNSFSPVPGDGTPAVPSHGHWPTASGSAALSSSTITAPPTNIGSIMNPIGSPSGNIPRGPVQAYVSPMFYNAMSAGNPRGGFQMPQGNTIGGAAPRPPAPGRRSYPASQGHPFGQGREAQQHQQGPVSPSQWSNQSRPHFGFPTGPSSMTFANRQHSSTLSASSSSYDPTTQSASTLQSPNPPSQALPDQSGNGPSPRR